MISTWQHRNNVAQQIVIAKPSLHIMLWSDRTFVLLHVGRAIQREHVPPFKSASERWVAGANHHFCCADQTFTSSSGTQWYVLYINWAFSHKIASLKLLRTGLLISMEAIQIITPSRHTTGGSSLPTLLPSVLSFVSRTFTLVWLFWLWNQVGCVFTVEPTFASGSHWSQIWSRTSAGRTICASFFFFFFGNLTLHLQHKNSSILRWEEFSQYH